MTTKEYIEGVVDDVIGMLVDKDICIKKEQTPELYRMIQDSIDAEFDSFDDFAAHVDKLVVDLVQKILGPMYVTAASQLRENQLPEVPACVEYYRQTVFVGSENFDAAPVLRLMNPKTVSRMEAYGYGEEGDEMFRTAAKLGLVAKHNKTPYCDIVTSCCITDQNALDVFRAECMTE